MAVAKWAASFTNWTGSFKTLVEKLAPALGLGQTR